MFDSHCHLDAPEYEGQIEAVLARAARADVRGIFLPACEPARWDLLAKLCQRDQRLCFGLGIHPWFVARYEESELVRAYAQLRKARDRGACAIGECGLDTPLAKRGGATLELQRKVLEAQLLIARELALPVVLHCVHAHGALLDVLERDGPLAAGGVLHSYGGSAELITRYERLGLSFSFAGTVTRPRAIKVRAAAKRVPLGRLLVESDGPDQVPSDVARTISEPCDVERVLRALAELRNEPFETLASYTMANAQRLFRERSH
jgi:TatD DNase family protein